MDLTRRSALAAVGAASAGTLLFANRSYAAGALNPVQPVVEIASGKIRGDERNGVRSWKGVPYGASTAGKNRFLPPQPPTPWAAVRDSLMYGPCSPTSPSPFVEVENEGSDTGQFVLYRNMSPKTASEDCLRLNVWAPTGNGNGKRPVLVFMHGGGFTVGSGHALLAYDGENLARRGDAVVITHNHRLNVFGYLDLSSFGGKWANSVNVGMQDIVAVLQWIRTNAAAFGGDAGNVTVFGQSGGGGKITALMAMPSAKGLFHKAIIESGAGGAVTTKAEATTLAHKTLAAMGVPENNLDKIFELKTETVCQPNEAWRPVVDGKVLPVAPIVGAGALASGIPLIVGSCLNDGASTTGNPKALTFSDADVMTAATEAYKGSAAAIVADYKKAWSKKLPMEQLYAMRSITRRNDAFTLGDKKFAVDGKAWQYIFSWGGSPMLGGTVKTFHTAEVAFVFDNAGLCVNQTGGGPDALKLAGQMSDAWLAFARNGDPNHSGMPKWPAFDKSHPTMAFDDPCVVMNDPEAAGRKLIAATA